MPLSHRDNYLRNLRFQGPDRIPTTVFLSPSIWGQLREELEDICLRHPVLYPNFQKGKQRFDQRPAYQRTFDAWGCAHEAAVDGVSGQITTHPLADWAALDSLVPPDPARMDDAGPVDWAKRRERAERARQAGGLVTGNIPHSSVYLRLGYLRGWENFLLDVGSADPRLDRLIAIIEAFNRELVRRWLDIGVDGINFADDLGAQHGTLLSPAQFRRYITPTYSRLARMAKQAGAFTYLHTDGYVVNILDQLLDWPIDIVNCQDLVNGVEVLAKELKGRACIDLDVDRQKIVPFGTPKEIIDLIEYEVRTLGSAAGGLCLTVGIYAPTPPENVDAVLTAFERFGAWWWR